jgi:hypothetical protein
MALDFEPKSLLFKKFCSQNGVQLIFAPPCSPQTNGVAERAVQTVKNFLKKVPESEWAERLDSFILGHNSTPLAATGIAPAEFNLGRKPATLLSKMALDAGLKQRQAQRDKKVAEELSRKAPKTVESGQQAVVRSYKDPKIRWEQAQVTSSLGPRRILLETSSGTVERHSDQVKVLPKRRSPEEEPPSPRTPHRVPPSPSPSPVELEPEESPEPPEALPPEPPEVSREPQSPARVRLPSRLKDFVIKK